jgi:tetratricopeptide (TPR) repeat protein
MKTKNFKSVVLFLTGMVISLVTFAQKPNIANNPKYGPDSVARMGCAAQLSIMNQYVRINTFEYAYDAWRYCFYNCPEASKNIYIHGAKILKYRIENATDEVSQKAFIDTLMLMYDQRMKYFRQEDKAYGMKGIDLLRYDKSALAEAHGYLEKAVDLGGKQVDESVAVTFISTTYALYQQQLAGADIMIGNYMKIMDLMNEKIKSGDKDPKIQQAIESIEKIFAESGAADCESLTNIFDPRFEASPNDLDLLKKITTLLSQTGCEKSELYRKTAEALYALEPNSESAAKLAVLFASREEYAKAEDYYSRAIDQETDSEPKARYYYNLANVKYQQKDYPAVRKHCNSAISLKSDFGEAYILIGKAYISGSSSCGETDFEKQAVYWVAVDKFIKARSVDPSVSESATEQINTYSKAFPNNEITFFNGYTDGQTYKLGCWIQENTTVRTTK